MPRENKSRAAIMSEKRAVFRSLHSPDTGVYQVANARRENSAEAYDADKILDLSEDMATKHADIAKEVFDRFTGQ